MTSKKVHTIWAALMVIATQIGAQSFADEIETIEVVEHAQPQPADPEALIQAEVDEVLATLAQEQVDKLQESTRDAYGQLVSELEMYDDGTRVVDTTDASQTEDQPGVANFLPRS